jgi:hypothetical protein
VSPNVPRAYLPAVPRALMRVLAAVGLLAGLPVWWVWRGLVWLGRVAGFVAGPVDELVTAWLGIPAVLPRVRRRLGRRWGRRVAQEWRAYRTGAIEGEVMDGVWR